MIEALQAVRGRCRLLAGLALPLLLLVGVPAARGATNTADVIEAGDRKLLADGLFSRGFHALALPEYLALAGRRPPPAAM